MSRLVIDLSEGISNKEFVRLHTLIYKLCTIPQVPCACSPALPLARPPSRSQ